MYTFLPIMLRLVETGCLVFGKRNIKQLARKNATKKQRHLQSSLFDEDNPLYFFSWSIIKHRVDEISVNTINEEVYTNFVKIKIK